MRVKWNILKIMTYLGFMMGLVLWGGYLAMMALDWVRLERNFLQMFNLDMKLLNKLIFCIFILPYYGLHIFIHITHAFFYDKQHEQLDIHFLYIIFFPIRLVLIFTFSLLYIPILILEIVIVIVNIHKKNKSRRRDIELARL